MKRQPSYSSSSQGQEEHSDCYARIKEWEYYMKSPINTDKNEDILSDEDNDSIQVNLRGIVNYGISSGSDSDGNSNGGSLMNNIDMYSWGRLSWNTFAQSNDIIKEYVILAFGGYNTVNSNNVASPLNTIYNILMNSWDIQKSYTSPLGLSSGGIYVLESTKEEEETKEEGGGNTDPKQLLQLLIPNPQTSNEKYIHSEKEEEGSIGFGRTSGSNSLLDLYNDEEIQLQYKSVNTCPKDLLLMFHRIDYTSNILLENDDKDNKDDSSSSKSVTLIEYLYQSYGGSVRNSKYEVDKWMNVTSKIIDYDTETYYYIQDISTMVMNQLNTSIMYCNVMGNYLYEQSNTLPGRDHDIPIDILCNPYAIKSTSLSQDGEEETILEDTVEDEIEEISEEEERTTNRRISLVAIFITLTGMIYTAYQIQDNPDGFYANMCLRIVNISAFILYIICTPCRPFIHKLFGRNNTAHHQYHGNISRSSSFASSASSTNSVSAIHQIPY